MSYESDKKVNGLIEKINRVNSNYDVIVGGSPTFQSHSKNPNFFLAQVLHYCGMQGTVNYAPNLLLK